MASIINNSLRKTENLTVKKAVLIYIMVSLFLAFEMAVQVSPSVMAPELMQDLDIGAFALGLMSSVYFYSYTSMQIPSGLLFDRFSPRKIIVFAILICSIGSIAFGFITNFYFGCFARLLMGIGSAFAFVSVLVMASKLFDSKWFPILTGITQMLAALGAMSGQLPVSLLVGSIGWRNTMFILGIFGIFLVVIIFCLLDNSRKNSNESKLSLENKNKNYNFKKSVGLILSNPQSWFIALYACLLWAPMSGFASLWGVPFLRAYDGLSPNSAAFYCSIMWLGLALGSPILGTFSTIINSKVILLTLSALLGTISFGFALWFHMHGLILMLCLFLSGAACSGQALSFSLVKDNNPIQIRGTAIAFNNMAVVISGVIFQPLIGAIISLNNKDPNFSLHCADDFRRGLIVILMAYFTATVVSLILIKEKVPLVKLDFKELRSYYVK